MGTNAFSAGFGMAKQKKNKGGNDMAPPGGGSSPFQAGAGVAQQKSQKKQAQNTLKKAQRPVNISTTNSPVSAMIPQAKKGGRVTKTGLVYVHRGEDIIPAKQRSKKNSSANRKRTITKP